MRRRSSPRSDARRGKFPSIPMSNSQSLAFSRRRRRPSFAKARPSESERAQGRPGTGWHPWSACNKKARGRTTGSAEDTRPSLRNGFNGFLRALPGDHSLVATVARETRERLHDLSACIGAPGPHDFAVRARASRLPPHPRPPHPASTFVTTRTPLFDEAGWRHEATDLGATGSEIFFRAGLDDPNQLERTGEISFYARAIL